MNFEDMVAQFAASVALTHEEQQVIVVDKQEAISLKTSKVFLVDQTFNKETFKIEDSTCQPRMIRFRKLQRN